MKKIAFSGTLDPITNGHMWVVQEARAIADEVVVFISENPFKKPQFPAEKRKEIVEKCIVDRGWANVSVILLKGNYTARTAKRLGIDYIIRGIRNTADFDYENLIQQTNVDVLQGSKTVFVMPPRDLGSVSSSFIRALQGPVGWHWSIQKFLPQPAYRAWILDWLRKDWESLWRYGHEDAQMTANADQWFAQLTGISSYGNPARRYHNLDHLVHGLSEIAVWAVNTGAGQREVETLKKAFWFHDAVYGVTGKDISNEEESARLWLDSKLEANVSDGPAALIRATDHLQKNAIEHPLKDVMLGVDLAILGQVDEVYDAYAQGVRAEHNHIGAEVYRIGRKQVLIHFLEKAQVGQLYIDPYFDDLYREKAIDNLKREISALNGNV